MLEEDVLLNFMNRNMINATQQVVDKLKVAAGNGFIGDYTIDGDKETQKWLIELEIKDLSNELKIKDNKIRLFPSLYAAWGVYKSESYLILINHDKEFRIPKYLEETNVNSGAWVAIIQELDLPLKNDFNDKAQEILGAGWEIIAKNGFKKIKFDTGIAAGFSLRDLFFDISLYKIKSKFTQTGQLHQLIGSVLVKGASYRLLPYSNTVVRQFEDIFENGNKYIPFDNILASYVASDFKFAYLDLYRCIEKLESLYFLSDLYKKLSLKNTSLLDFCKSIDDSIGLYRLDSHTNLLKKLLGSIEKNNKTFKDNSRKFLYLIFLTMKLPVSVNRFKCIKYIVLYSDGFYDSFIKNIIKESEKLNKVRNFIVHLSPNQVNEVLPQDSLGWNEYICNILYLVKILYDINQDLFEI